MSWRVAEGKVSSEGARLQSFKGTADWNQVQEFPSGVNRQPAELIFVEYKAGCKSSAFLWKLCLVHVK